ncbi:MAG TPA: hypothetical protein VFJ30_11625 [Phycisphaerae bacterium]|nr:hypothetical protein [Phycisphaerae bacterium]
MTTDRTNGTGASCGSAVTCCGVLMLLLSSFAHGCAAPAGPDELNYPLYQPLVNGRLVTIEVICVNGARTPGKAIEKAVAAFGKHVAGEVRMRQGKPVRLAGEENGAISHSQVVRVARSRPACGPSDITIYVVPGMVPRGRGLMLGLADGGHVVIINAEATKHPPPLVSREGWCRLVVMHELCHALRVPSDRSRAWSARHCTRPDCVLYPRPDLRAVLTAIVRLGPPMDLCGACRREVHAARQAHRGELIDPDAETLLDWLNEIVRLNPRRALGYLMRGQAQAQSGNHAQAARDFATAAEVAPDNAMACNNLAWLLATCGDDKVRDGPRAVEFARRACKLTSWKDPNLLDTLAAACAEAGEFDQAVQHQQKAIWLAGKNAPRFQGRLKLYRQGKPFHAPKR